MITDEMEMNRDDVRADGGIESDVQGDGDNQR